MFRSSVSKWYCNKWLQVITIIPLGNNFINLYQTEHTIELRTTFTQRRKISKNRNQKLLFVHCRPTTGVPFFTFKKLGQWPTFYSNGLLMFIEKNVKIIHHLYFVIIRNNRTLCLLENDKTWIALLISYFYESF